MAPRYAVYFTPPPDHPLTAAAERWLGRDAFAAKSVAPVIEGLDTAEAAAVTREPARYGFHATLKAPFHLAEGRGEHDLLDAFRDFCRERRAFGISLVPARIGGFVALVPIEACPDLTRLADDCVARFEPFRAPLSDDDIARRRPERLSPSERAHLLEWGYPYVFADFRFHMTLTNSLADDAGPGMLARAEKTFAPLLGAPLPVAGLALFVQPDPAGPFAVREYRAFG